MEPDPFTIAVFRQLSMNADNKPATMARAILPLLQSAPLPLIPKPNLKVRHFYHQDYFERFKPFPSIKSPLGHLFSSFRTASLAYSSVESLVFLDHFDLNILRIEAAPLPKNIVNFKNSRRAGKPLPLDNFLCRVKYAEYARGIDVVLNGPVPLAMEAGLYTRLSLSDPHVLREHGGAGGRQRHGGAVQRGAGGGRGAGGRGAARARAARAARARGLPRHARARARAAAGPSAPARPSQH